MKQQDRKLARLLLQTTGEQLTAMKTKKINEQLIMDYKKLT